MENKFYQIETEYEITHINVDFIREWKLNWEGVLKITFIDGTTYAIDKSVKIYNTLLTLLKSRTVYL